MRRRRRAAHVVSKVELIIAADITVFRVGVVQKNAAPPAGELFPVRLAPAVSISLRVSALPAPPVEVLGQVTSLPRRESNRLGLRKRT